MKDEKEAGKEIELGEKVGEDEKRERERVEPSGEGYRRRGHGRKSE